MAGIINTGIEIAGGGRVGELSGSTGMPGIGFDPKTAAGWNSFLSNQNIVTNAVPGNVMSASAWSSGQMTVTISVSGLKGNAFGKNAGTGYALTTNAYGQQVVTAFEVGGGHSTATVSISHGVAGARASISTPTCIPNRLR